MKQPRRGLSPCVLKRSLVTDGGRIMIFPRLWGCFVGLSCMSDTARNGLVLRVGFALGGPFNLRVRHLEREAEEQGIELESECSSR